MNIIFYSLFYILMAPLVFPASIVVLTFSGKITSIDPSGTEAPPVSLGTPWMVELRYPQDTPLPESDSEIIEEPTIRVPQASTRVTLGDQTWNMSDMQFKYDRIHYVSFWDNLALSAAGSPLVSFGLVFSSFGSPIDMIQRPYFLPNTSSDWNLSISNYFEFGIEKNSLDQPGVDWNVYGRSLDAVTFAIIPEPSAIMAFCFASTFFVRNRRRSTQARRAL
jgi:hypothetical protein